MTTAGVCKKLKERYMSKMVLNCIHMKQHFFDLKMKNKKSLINNLDDFMKLVQEMESL